MISSKTAEINVSSADESLQIEPKPILLETKIQKIDFANLLAEILGQTYHLWHQELNYATLNLAMAAKNLLTHGAIYTLANTLKLIAAVGAKLIFEGGRQDCG